MTDVAIIEVPINDEKFRAFYELFKEYSEKLDEQPAAWKKLNEAIGKATPSAGGWASHFSNTAGSSDEVVKNLTASTKAMKDLFAATQKSNAAMGTLLENSTGVARGLLGAASGVGGLKKALGFLSAVPGVGSAVRAAGLAVGTVGVLGDLAFQSAASVSNTARAAFGAVGPGGSRYPYGVFQNTNAALGQFLPNPGAALQNVAAAQYNPMAWGQLGLFGVTPGQSSQSAMATILQQAIGSVRSSHTTILPQATYAKSLLGISDTDLISLANQNPKDVYAAYQQMLNPKAAAAQNVSGKVVSSDQNLLRSWATSMNTASAKFAAALAPMNPIVASFGQDVAGFAGAVDKLVQATGGAASQASKLLQGGTSGWGSIFPGLPIALGGKGNGPGGIQSQQPAPGQLGQSTVGAVMQSFMNRGYSKKFAAAMASQAFSESSFRTYAPSTYKGQQYGGMFQWNQTRRDQILKATGIDVWSQKTSEDQQAAAAVWELRNTYKNAADKINASPNAITAGTAADRYYEVSADSDPARIMRGIRAGAMYEFGPNAPVKSATPSATDAATAALLRRLAKQNIIKVQATVTNNTAARVNMSANAAVR